MGDGRRARTVEQAGGIYRDLPTDRRVIGPLRGTGAKHNDVQQFLLSHLFLSINFHMQHDVRMFNSF